MFYRCVVLVLALCFLSRAQVIPRPDPASQSNGPGDGDGYFYIIACTLPATVFRYGIDLCRPIPAGVGTYSPPELPGRLFAVAYRSPVEAMREFARSSRHQVHMFAFQHPANSTLVQISPGTYYSTNGWQWTVDQPGFFVRLRNNLRSFVHGNHRLRHPQAAGDEQLEDYVNALPWVQTRSMDELGRVPSRELGPGEAGQEMDGVFYVTTTMLPETVSSAGIHPGGLVGPGGVATLVSGSQTFVVAHRRPEDALRNFHHRTYHTPINPRQSVFVYAFRSEPLPILSEAEGQGQGAVMRRAWLGAEVASMARMPDEARSLIADRERGRDVTDEQLRAEILGRLEWLSPTTKNVELNASIDMCNRFGLWRRRTAAKKQWPPFRPSWPKLPVVSKSVRGTRGASSIAALTQKLGTGSRQTNCTNLVVGAAENWMQSWDPQAALSLTYEIIDSFCPEVAESEAQPPPEAAWGQDDDTCAADPLPQQGASGVSEEEGGGACASTSSISDGCDQELSASEMMSRFWIQWEMERTNGTESHAQQVADFVGAQGLDPEYCLHALVSSPYWDISPRKRSAPPPAAAGRGIWNTYPLSATSNVDMILTTSKPTMAACCALRTRVKRTLCSNEYRTDKRRILKPPREIDVETSLEKPPVVGQVLPLEE
ncbi:hypothetical protein XA68_17658 [Ophiocordyceps unilateralis]|uniref:Enterotoxin n=1 Tax=Ophiocordyceps unilateralis TaxID=268505 RepID=A0A2A9P2V4_OPHUN|nr:hypothetical protein XA68_17658 [Ophiocordyceps unilateralis]